MEGGREQDEILRRLSFKKRDVGVILINEFCIPLIVEHELTLRNPDSGIEQNVSLVRLKPDFLNNLARFDETGVIDSWWSSNRNLTIWKKKKNC